MWSCSLKWVSKNSKWLFEYVLQTTFYGRNSFFFAEIFIFTDKSEVVFLEQKLRLLKTNEHTIFRDKKDK